MTHHDIQTPDDDALIRDLILRARRKFGTLVEIERLTGIRQPSLSRYSSPQPPDEHGNETNRPSHMRTRSFLRLLHIAGGNITRALPNYDPRAAGDKQLQQQIEHLDEQLRYAYELAQQLLAVTRGKSYLQVVAEEPPPAPARNPSPTTDTN